MASCSAAGGDGDKTAARGEPCKDTSGRTGPAARTWAVVRPEMPAPTTTTSYTPLSPPAAAALPVPFSAGGAAVACTRRQRCLEAWRSWAARPEALADTLWGTFAARSLPEAAWRRVAAEVPAGAPDSTVVDAMQANAGDREL